MTEDLVALIAEETEIAAGIVAAVEEEQFARPTPCVGFDVRQLINHMCMVNHFFAKIVDGERARPDYERDFVGDDHAAGYARTRDELVRAIAAPGALERNVLLAGNETPAEVAFVFLLMEAVVHRWDLATAVELNPAVRPEVAAMLLERVSAVIPDRMRAEAAHLTTRSIPFGPPVEVSPSAPLDQLVAFLGRDPRVAAETVAGSDTARNDP